jgi:hypothetical protein
VAELFLKTWLFLVAVRLMLWLLNCHHLSQRVRPVEILLFACAGGAVFYDAIDGSRMSMWYHWLAVGASLLIGSFAIFLRFGASHWWHDLVAPERG